MIASIKEIPTPQRADFPAEIALIGDLSFSIKYIIKPTKGIKNEIIFKPVDGTSCGFELSILKLDSLCTGTDEWVLFNK